MATLAIKGHKTRGKEIIEIFRMLYGDIKHSCMGTCTSSFYYVENGDIFIRTQNDCDEFQVFTIEEFEEKYPYKVGDRVRIPEYESEVRINKMYWDGNEVQYEVVTDEVEWYSAKELNEFNEPKLTPKRDLRFTQLNTELLPLADKVELILGDYEIKEEDNKTYLIKKKPQYPKTYEECCEVLKTYCTMPSRPGYKEELMAKFQELLICRDAYWKIYGEQMGLGKPWEPDWKKQDKKYIISVFDDTVIYFENETSNRNVILAFPTPEMRDVFYENFKDLIEQCKELL